MVILTSKVLRSSSTNLFLLNLSVADLLVLVTCTPTTLVEIITRKDDWILGKVRFNFLLGLSLENIQLHARSQAIVIVVFTWRECSNCITQKWYVMTYFIEA